MFWVYLTLQCMPMNSFTVASRNPLNCFRFARQGRCRSHVHRRPAAGRHHPRLPPCISPALYSTIDISSIQGSCSAGCRSRRGRMMSIRAACARTLVTPLSAARTSSIQARSYHLGRSSVCTLRSPYRILLTCNSQRSRLHAYIGRCMLLTYQHLNLSRA